MPVVLAGLVLCCVVVLVSVVTTVELLTSLVLVRVVHWSQS